MAAEDVRNLFEPGKHFSGIGIFFIALFAGACAWFYMSSRTYFRPRTRRLRVGEAPKRKHLILFLSNLNSNSPHTDGVPAGVTLSNDLAADIATLTASKLSRGIRWPWEMPLRAIDHHSSRLKTITLICSVESMVQAHWFRAILARYRALASLSVQLLVNSETGPQILVCPGDRAAEARRGWDFEDFDSLMEGVVFLLKEYSIRNYPEKEIVVDFTGGQKVTSVVAAAATVNLSVIAQYVQTNSPWAVKAYDLTEGRSDTGPPGL